MPDAYVTQTGSWGAKELQVRGCELENIADGTNGEIVSVTLPKGAISVIFNACICGEHLGSHSA